MSKYIYLILIAVLILISAKPQQDYIVIERDYEGDILLDPESGMRYLRTDEKIYVIEGGKVK